MSGSGVPLPPTIPGSASLRDAHVDTLEADTLIMTNDGTIECVSLVASSSVTASSLIGETLTLAAPGTATCASLTATGALTGAELVFSGKATYNQATSITTAVPITGASGKIVTQAATTASTASSSFNITDVSNLIILANSTVHVTLVSYSGTPLTNGIPIISVSAVALGSATVTISNYGANALNGTFTLFYSVV